MNKELWKMYKDSPRGKECIELFIPDGKSASQMGFDILRHSEKWGGDCIDEDSLDHLKGFMWLWDANMWERGLATDVWNRDDFQHMMEEMDILDPLLDENGDLQYSDDDVMLFSTDKPLIRKDEYREKASSIPWLSLLLYSYDNVFKPMLLPRRFDIIQRNCDALGIELPDIPRGKNYREYYGYYYDICMAWDAFQEENDLSNAELCACIYDFASMLCEKNDKTVFPKPTNVWLTGAGNGDFTFLDSLGKDGDGNEEHIWACNERTRRGDIIVIYCTSPRSYIHSIWRSEGGGFFNPFDYYHCRSKVCEGILTPPITFNDLRGDAYMSQVPIIKRRLQGINGIELTAKDYSELMRMIKERGGNPSLYPQLFDGSDVDFGEISVEKDVEEKILIPMLQKLGYTPDDWTRQLSLKAGRTEKAIPDFVFFPRGEKHFESAPMVIEAKLDMASIREQTKTFNQGLSYARMLRSSIMGICDKERLVLYRIDKNGAADRNNPFYENHWGALYPDEVEGAKLKQIIGREVVVKL